MLEIKIFNIVLFILLLASLYTLIFQYRTKDNVIIKAKLIHKEILNNKVKMIFLVICLVIVFSSIIMLLYSIIDEFHSTKYFRNEYAISFGELINDDRIEKLVDELEGEEKRLGKSYLKRIRASKTILSYIINMVCLMILFPKIATIKIEKHGIRKFVFLTRWKEYTSYFWNDDEINFISLKSKVVIKFRIDYQEKDNLNNYLNEETNLIEKKNYT